MDPYRSPLVAHAEAPRDPGIVGDVIAQFADATAFLRELVQNAIDAGSPSVEVRFEVDGDIVRIAVKDRGEGMTREIVEDQLLVLFRSTKEKDASKIGKFGIGFASVLAPNPEVVAIHTARDGRRLTVHLYRDLTYQLFDAGPATQTGTTVEVDLRAAEPEPLLADCRAALAKWCRHASVPITFSWRLGGDTTTERVDRPLALDDALVQVERREGELVCVVGVTATAAPYAGFFNHGLTLYETSEPLVGKLAVKLQDPSLGHTLSRDNVRRDARFNHALAFARAVAERDLPMAAEVALREAAESDRARHQALVAGLQAAGVELRAWTFPLVEPLADGRTTIAAADLPRRAWCARDKSELTAVVREPILYADPVTIAALHELAHVTLVDLERELTAVSPAIAKTKKPREGVTGFDISDIEEVLEPHIDAEVLGSLVADALEAANCAPSAVIVARLSGAHADALAIGGHGRPPPYTVDRDQAAQSPFARLRRPPLVLSVAHPLVQAAAGHPSPRLGASHLARAILLHYKLLDVERSAALLDAVLE